VRQTAGGALPDVPGVDDLGVLAAVRAVRVDAVPVGQADHVDRHPGLSVAENCADLAESGVRLVSRTLHEYGEHGATVSRHTRARLAVDAQEDPQALRRLGRRHQVQSGALGVHLQLVTGHDRHLRVRRGPRLVQPLVVPPAIGSAIQYGTGQS